MTNTATTPLCLRAALLGVALAATTSTGVLASADPADDPYPSTYRVLPAAPVLIRGARIHTGDGRLFPRGYVQLAGGIIEAVGDGDPAAVDPRVTVIDAAGKTVTPGLIDVHSHVGDGPAPQYPPMADFNEATSPVTPEVWAEHSVWPQDPQFPLALAGGVTTLQVLPGSANLFGGRGVTLKNVSARTVQEMKFPGAPYGLKMACGENPKRVYGDKGRAPSTRMGIFAMYRDTWLKAVDYKAKWDAWASKADHAGPSGKGAVDGDTGDDAPPEPPKRDLQLETLVGVLEGRILVHNHCYRADEIAQVLDLSREFGYRVAAFHHAVEAYKVADLLAEYGACVAMWADWWRFKFESFDGIPENVALVHRAGACAIVHSDSAIGIQRLNQEAAKALAAGRRMGLELSDADAIRWITLNAAMALGVGDRTGSLEVGKMADVVLWNGDPLSVYARAEKVFVDGRLVLDLEKDLRPVTDFELGHRVREVGE